MNLAELEKKLVRAARRQTINDTVPYAFEKRIMALLLARKPMDEWSLWSRALWRASAPCVAIMLLLSAWSVLAPKFNAPVTDLSQALENVVLAAVDQEQPAD